MSNFLNQDFGSEDEEDDFNPIPQEESDAEEPRAQVGLQIPAKPRWIKRLTNECETASQERARR